MKTIINILTICFIILTQNAAYGSAIREISINKCTTQIKIKTNFDEKKGSYAISFQFYAEIHLYQMNL